MLPLTLTDRRGETYVVFRADAVIPFGYYPADIDRGLGWAERFVFSLPMPEQKRLRDYAYGIRPFFGLDPLIELLAQRRLLIYRKDTSKDDKLAIEVLRNSIREVLDQILAEEKKEADAIAREHEKRNILEKGLAYKQEFDKGMVEGAWSLLKFLKEVNDVVSPMMILTRAGKSAWDAAEGGLQGFAGRFSRNMNTAQYREIVEALGFDPAEIDQKTLYLAFDIATVVWEDEDTQAIITRFARNLAAAQHSLEWANIAGGAAFEIVLTAILAALTAGAGATVALAGKGKYLRRLGELLRDLAEPLKRLKRRWGKGSRGKGAGSGKKAVVEEVATPGYNEPPRERQANSQGVLDSENSQVSIVADTVDESGGITPENLGILSISQDQRLLSMWTDSLKHLSVAETKSGDKYRAYLNAMAEGNVPKEVARSAYEEVAVQFRRRLKAAQNSGEVFEGFNFERLHHWNWPISDYPEDATNARKLFPLSHEQHMDVHRAATSGPHPTKDPIDPANVMSEASQSLLPDNYFD